MCCIHCPNGDSEAQDRTVCPVPSVSSRLKLSPGAQPAVPCPLALLSKRKSFSRSEQGGQRGSWLLPQGPRPVQTCMAGICSGYSCLPSGCLGPGPGPQGPGTLLSVYFLPGFCTDCGFHLERLQWELRACSGGWAASVGKFGFSRWLTAAAKTLVPEFPHHGLWALLSLL